MAPQEHRVHRPAQPLVRADALHADIVDGVGHDRAGRGLDDGRQIELFDQVPGQRVRIRPVQDRDHVDPPRDGVHVDLRGHGVDVHPLGHHGGQVELVQHGGGEAGDAGEDQSGHGRRQRLPVLTAPHRGLPQPRLRPRLPGAVGEWCGGPRGRGERRHERIEQRPPEA